MNCIDSNFLPLQGEAHYLYVIKTSEAQFHSISQHLKDHLFNYRVQMANFRTPLFTILYHPATMIYD